MSVKVSGFDWDGHNREKCQKHGVSLAEIEALFSGPLDIYPDPAHSREEKRMLAIGRNPEGRHIFLAFTIRAKRSQSLIRPISARYMHRKEIEHYEEKDS